MSEEHAGWGLLDELAAVHHGDFIGVAGNDTKVVSNKNHRHVAIAALFADELQNLRLHRDVERSGGFVCKQQCGAARQGNSDHCSLTHAARQFVWVLIEAAGRFGNSHIAQQPLGGCAGVGSRHIEMQVEWFSDLLTNLHQRVERCHWVLEHHRHFASPETTHLLGGQSKNLLALKLHRTRCDGVRTGQQTHQRT
ncbi:unannotated protein [freshwater metagenome]|uniref:Unannotated protein n=1 Tax=freshwater metagenome TaxID=449393 RepID=A0A6J6YBL1_9ZZZZ